MLSTGICEGTSHWDGWIPSHPWVRGHYSVSTRIRLSCCRPNQLKCTLPGMEHVPSKRGEGEVLVWHFPPTPQSISSHLCFPTSTTGSSSKCCSHINIQGSDHSCSSYRRGRPLHISSYYVSVLLTLVFCCSCGFQSWDGHLTEIPFYSGPT